MTSHTYPQETEAFWKKHITVCEQSRQSKAAYARAHALNYSRFLYWVDRLKKKKPQKPAPTLLPVKIVPQDSGRVLARIQHAKGYHIEVYEMTALLYLLHQR
jgi:hypothetical protein